ncbi:MAG TPA: hypothetical protein DGG95_09240 [Cytophagales bacterium]|jgi:beta-lactamase class C|nr:hypothetical protein [Cytophagales bacterium]
MKAAFWIVSFSCVALFFFNLSSRRADVSALPLKDSVVAKVVAAPKKMVATEENPFVKETINEFESFVKTMIANGQAPGAAVAIVRDTNIIFLKGFGLREMGKPDSINARTVFRVGSVSKSITATLCAVLVQQGIIDWDDPVKKYLPDFKLKSESATEKLKLRHLLSHTEGLPYHAYTDMVDRNAPVDTLIDYLQDLDLIAEPGKIHSYQNVGFSLIGKVIEAATHRSFEDVITEKLFKPLSMDDASASYQKIIEDDDVAKPHQVTRPRKISPTYFSVAPAGGINASAQDMALWLKALICEKPTMFPSKRINEMLKPQVWAPIRNYYFYKLKKVRKPFYALGWRIFAMNNDTLAYHGGFVNNYRCEVAFSRKNKIGIAILVNTPGMLADQAVPKFFSIYDRHLDSISRWKRRPSL